MLWNGLPPELRLAILARVAGPDPNVSQHTPRGHQTDRAPASYAWAPYAAVSREWQEFFERRSFAALTLSSAAGDVDVFAAAVARCPRRLTYTARLQLIVDLPAYSEEEGMTDEDAATMVCHQSLFTHYVWRLLRALSLWREEPEPGAALERPAWLRDDALFRAGTLSRAIGIQLELGVQCRSDTELFDFRMLLPFRPYNFGPQVTRELGLPFKNRCERWHRARRSIEAPPAAARRVLGQRHLVLGKDPDCCCRCRDCQQRQQRRPRIGHRQHRHTLPVAPVVRKLVLGHRFHRGIHPDTLARLLRAFPRVQSAHLEPWRRLPDDNHVLLRGYGTLLGRLPPSLDCLSIFVESDALVHFRMWFPHLRHVRPGGRPPPGPARDVHLGHQVAVASLGLAELNVAFLAEADDVLAAIARMLPRTTTTTWPPRLRRLVLTSSTLTPATSPAQMAQLLGAVATAAAARLPHLRQLELWYAHGRHACAFTVDCVDSGSAGSTSSTSSTTTGTPRLTLLATWPEAAEAITQDVLGAWRAVVATWTHRPLEITIRPWIQTTRETKYRGQPERRSIDARRLLLFDGPTATLAREAVFAQSRQDMAQERFWKSKNRSLVSLARRARRGQEASHGLVDGLVLSR